MPNDILPLLKMHDYFRGLSDETLVDVAKCVQVVQCESGQCVHQANALIRSVGFLVRGRLKAILIDAHGRESLHQFVERGEQYGMISAALTEPLPISIIAIEPSTLLMLDYEVGLDLTLTHPDLRRRFSQAFATRLRKKLLPEAPERRRSIVTVFHQSPETRSLTNQLLHRLLELDEKLCVFSDHTAWKPKEDILFCHLVDGQQRMSELEMRRQVNRWPDSDRIIVDADAAAEPEWVSRMMELSDRVLWCLHPEDADLAAEQLQVVESRAPGWRDKISVVWCLQDEYISPVASHLRALVNRDFKVSTVDVKLSLGLTVSAGLERLVHYLRGIQVGVALGGGAARGMAHLGVLKALEQQGIVVDMIAGTSAGAMTGIMYAGGLEPEYAAGLFADDLQPSWLFRLMPHGSYWYLMYKYRRGQFDPMLRRYLEDWRLEQLTVPCHAVTVDLIGGQAVVREQGDAVHAILESINLPVLSAPICRNGQALVDGGLVKNIPADVLVSKGCNFVIAVSVTAKMEQAFGKNRPDTATGNMKSPGSLQTVMRSLLVQSHNMNSIGVQPADVMIEPDVTGFELSEFTRADELAVIGEQATSEQMPKIKTLLTRMDKELFNWD